MNRPVRSPWLAIVALVAAASVAPTSAHEGRRPAPALAKSPSRAALVYQAIVE